MEFTTSCEDEIIRNFIAGKSDLRIHGEPNTRRSRGYQRARCARNFETRAARFLVFPRSACGSARARQLWNGSLLLLEIQPREQREKSGTKFIRTRELKSRTVLIRDRAAANNRRGVVIRRAKIR